MTYLTCTMHDALLINEDVNDDGVVNSLDVLMVLQAAIGAIAL